MTSFREQLILIIYFLIFGSFLGIIYDLIHFYLNKLVLKNGENRKFGVKHLISYLIELGVWIGVSFLATSYLMKVTNGALTIYTFLFLTLGVLNHFYFLHKHFIADLERFDLFLKKLNKTIIIIVYPKSTFHFLEKVRRWLIKKFKTKIFFGFSKIFKRKKKNKEELSIDSETNDAI